MVVLVPFLLITAVFSRVTIMELNLPSGGTSAADKQQLSIEVIVREKGLEISNGKQVLALSNNGSLNQVFVFEGDNTPEISPNPVDLARCRYKFSTGGNDFRDHTPFYN